MRTRHPRDTALPSSTAPPSFDPHVAAPDADHVAEALRRVIGNLVREVRSAANTPSSAQAETLGLLDRLGPSSISAMAAQRHVKHQSMRLVVAQLELQQQVSRAPDPLDARKQLIQLTDQGRDTLQRSRQQRSDWLARQLKEKASAAQLHTLDEAVRILEQLITTNQSDESR